LSASGGVTVSGGSLFGIGSIKGNLQSSGIIRPGDSASSTGILTDSGAYTQNTPGSLDISIGGTTAGSKFDELNSTSAKLSGTLNIKLINGFVPTLGATFKILNFNSSTGTFGAVNGLAINSTEHFKITYPGTDVLLTVVSGAALAVPTVTPSLATGQIRLGSESFARGGSIRLLDSANLGSSAGSSFRLGHAWSFTGSSTGAKLSVIMADRRAPAVTGNFLSMRQYGSSRSHMNLDGRGRPAGRVIRGNMQFSSMNLFSKPNFSFAVE
jgi:hypothetical protein